MIFLMWIYHGLKSDTVVRALHELIRQYRPSVVFLSGTKMKNHIIEGVRRWMNYHKGFDVPHLGVASGLSLWWNEKMEVNVLSSSKNLIHSETRQMGKTDWFTMSWVYSNPYRLKNEEFWRWITSVLKPKDCLWFCRGDLNEILWDSENEGGY
ncbi:hypothetical protein ACFX2G_029196 [Malus domestica]